MLEGFLGILIERKEDVCIKLLKEGLLDKLKAILRLQDSQNNPTTAESKIWHQICIQT